MLGIIAVVAILGIAGLVLILHHTRNRYTANQMIFDLAITRIANPQDWHRHGFTPKGMRGIGDEYLPHCILAAVAAHDPTFTGRNVLTLSSVQHLTGVSIENFGLMPASVNDTLGHEATIRLLELARDSA